MKTTWTGVLFCGFVLYFGVVHSLGNPLVLLNAHALILVIGGTVGIALLSYSRQRLAEVVDYVLFGFLFRVKKTELAVAKDLIGMIDVHYGEPATFSFDQKIHPFLQEAFKLIKQSDLDKHEVEAILKDRRDSIKRKYIEDARILNNIAKYPPHLGLMGAASGMIEMMSGLGKVGVDSIGASMAIALSATLWGVGLNNFVFLPLSDNSMKVSEDEIFLRDVIIECCLMIKQNASHSQVINKCLNRLALGDRGRLAQEYREALKNRQLRSKKEHFFHVG